MAHILVIIMFMKLGGPVVATQEFSNKENCQSAITYLQKKLEDVTMTCLPK